MPTQKLPRPHVFTPPDLTLLIRDIYDRPQKRPLIGRYVVAIGGRVPDNPVAIFPDDPTIPPDVRGVTRVDYVHAENYNSSLVRHIYGEGRAYLHTPDVFSEPFGVSLATIRAVTDLISKHQPINAADIGVRAARYLDDVYDHFDFFDFELQYTRPLERALGKLYEAIQKCQASK